MKSAKKRVFFNGFLDNVFASNRLQKKGSFLRSFSRDRVARTLTDSAIADAKFWNITGLQGREVVGLWSLIGNELSALTPQQVVERIGAIGGILAVWILRASLA